MTWRETAACHPDNWTELADIYGERVHQNWWIPTNQGSRPVGAAYGLQVCSSCVCRAECSTVGSTSEGVWGGELR